MTAPEQNIPYGYCHCGCGQKTRVKDGAPRKFINTHHSHRHGHASHGHYTRTYRCWSGMLSRCNNPHATNYERYGGRGITVCERWHRFDNFLADMGETPKGLTLERVDNSGNYEPNNCRWATRKEQQSNTRSNRRLEWEGKQLTFAQLTQLSGISHSTLWYRLDKGMSVQEAISLPIDKRYAHNR